MVVSLLFGQVFCENGHRIDISNIFEQFIILSLDGISNASQEWYLYLDVAENMFVSKDHSDRYSSFFNGSSLPSFDSVVHVCILNQT